jgi:hypothetical protein
MDAYDGFKPMELSLKYFEPLVVIEDILSGNYSKDLNIVPSRYYTRKELSKKLGYGKKALARIEKLNVFKCGHSNEVTKSSTIFYKGSDIINNMVYVVSRSEATVSVVEENYLLLLEVGKRLGVTKEYLSSKILSNKDVFGVKVTEKDIMYEKCRHIRLKESVANEIIINKKGYILRSDVFLTKDYSAEIRNSLTVALVLSGDNDIDLYYKYIEKTKAIKLKKHLDIVIDARGKKLLAYFLHLLKENTELDYITFDVFLKLLPKFRRKEILKDEPFGLSINLKECRDNNIIYRDDLLAVLSTLVSITRNMNKKGK